MNFLKALISWKLWLSILLGIGLLVGLWFFTFHYLDEYTEHGVTVNVPDMSEMTIQEAMKLLDEKGLKYEVDSIKFSDNYPPFAILDYYPVAGSEVKPGRRIFIKSNPSTWQPIELPNLVNKSKRIALTQLTMKGFVLGDTIYVQDPAKDAVLGMLYNGDTVQKGAMLPKGAKIDLILGRGFGVDKNVPDLTGMTLAEAKRQIRTNFFDLGQVYYLGSRDTTATKVIYQDPPPNDLYDEGLPISIWLSTQSKSQLRREIDSLNLLFRRVMGEDDSLFYKSVESSRNIDIKDLPDEIRNQVKYDEQTRQDKGKDNTNAYKNASDNSIDTTGIIIE